MTGRLPGTPQPAKNISPELTQRLRSQRPGYDQVYALMQKYSESSHRQLAEMSTEDIRNNYVQSLFQALGWSVNLEAGFQNETSLFDLELEYHNLRIPVEITRPDDPIKFEASDIMRTWRGAGTWGILTNFENIQIWDIDQQSLILETSPWAYIAEDNHKDNLLAAQIFYERLAQSKSKETQASESPQQIFSLEKPSDISETPEFDAYLCHSSIDKPWVSQLKGDLEKYGLRIWLDRDGLQPGDDWAKKIEAAINTSRAIVIVVSPESMKSEYVKRDIEQAFSLLREGNTIKIIPVILGTAEIPESIRRFTWVDFRDAGNYDRQVWELIGGITGQKPPKILKLNETPAHVISQRIEPSGIPSAEAFGKPQVTSASDRATISEQVNVAISPPSSAATRLEIAIRALADKPSDVDLLGFKDYAEALADFIKEPKTEKPLTIGIDAAWGMGKTTLMRMIRQRLEGQPNENIHNSFPIEQRPFRDVAKEMIMVILKTLWRLIKVVIISPWSLIKFIVKIVRTTLIMIWTFLLRIILRKETGQKQNVRESFPTVWFNAWKYDEEESLWAALVLEILGQVRRQLSWRQQTWLNLKLNWKRFDWGLLRQRVIKYLAVYIFLVGILGTLTFGIASLWLGATWQESWRRLSEYIQLVGGLGFLTAIYAAGKQVFDSLTSPFDLKLEQYLRQPNYAEKVGFLAQFEADFKRVIDVVTENGKWPLVVFIDDLDRCAPPKPVEIIEAINLLLDSQHCVFILGMDAQTVAGSIEAKYKDLLANLTETDAPGSLSLGQRFLEKIVQINFRIPQVKPEVMTAFIEANLVPLTEKPAPLPTQAKVAEAENLIKAEQRAGTKSVEAAAQAVQAARPDLPPEVITAAKQEVQAKSFDDSEEVKQAIRDAIPYLDFNPRKIKRFINLLRLQALIANRRGLLENNVIRLDILAKWLLLAALWPDTIEAISDDPQFIYRLQEAQATHQELQKRRYDVYSTEDLQELDLKNEQIKATETKLNVFLADPCIKQFITPTDLAKLLAGLDSSTEAMAQYLHLAQISVDSTAKQQSNQSDSEQ